MSRILYALPAWGFLSKELTGRLDRNRMDDFLKRCCRYDFTSTVKRVDILFDNF